MKVAYLLGGLNRGGAETLMLDVFRNNEKAPFSFIGIHRKDGAYKDSFYEAGPTMYKLTPQRFGRLTYLLRLRQLLKEENITIVHTQHWLDCIYAGLAIIGLNIRLINTFHGFYKLSGFMGLLCRLSMNMADDICFVSEYEKQWYIDKTGINADKCHVIYNGIDFSKFDNDYQEPQYLNIENSVICNESPVMSRAATGQAIRLTMVGSFGGGRSHKVIIESINLLCQRGFDNFDFYFIGKRNNTKPWLYDECVQYCKKNGLKNVRFLGECDDVPSLLKTMDGFVYSTICDTFGIAVVEAMATGLPVVVNDWVVMKEVCGEDSYPAVRFFQSDNPNDCAEKMIELITTINESQSAARVYSIKVKNKYSIDNHIQKLFELYNENN